MEIEILSSVLWHMREKQLLEQEKNVGQVLILLIRNWDVNAFN